MVSMCFLSNSKLDYLNYKKITIILLEKVNNCVLLTIMSHVTMYPIYGVCCHISLPLF